MIHDEYGMTMRDLIREYELVIASQYCGPPVAKLDCSGTCSFSHTSSRHHPVVLPLFKVTPGGREWRERERQKERERRESDIYQRLLQFSLRSEMRGYITLNRILTCARYHRSSASCFAWSIVISPKTWKFYDFFRFVGIHFSAYAKIIFWEFFVYNSLIEIFFFIKETFISESVKTEPLTVNEWKFTWLE